MIQHNRVFDTGGSTQIASIHGISSSNSVDILDNTVSGVTPASGSGGAAYGIQTQNNSSGRASGSIGLRCANTDGNTDGNIISAFETGISNCYDNGNLVRP